MLALRGPGALRCAICPGPTATGERASASRFYSCGWRPATLEPPPDPLPILFLTFILETPDATISVVLSLVPFFSPILMMLRAAITSVPAWQMLGAFGLLGATFLVMIGLAGRIYRVGILSYGKTPSLREIARWVTYR